MFRYFDNLSPTMRMGVIFGGGAALVAGIVYCVVSLIELCEEGTPGRETMSEVFNGVSLPTCIVEADELYAYEAELPYTQQNSYEESRRIEELRRNNERGKDIRYLYNETGMLVIRGGLPSETSVSITRGRIVIEGDMLEGSKACATLPYKTRRESYMSTCTRTSANNTVTTYPCTQYRTVFDGFVYETDTSPAVHVWGNTYPETKIVTNAGVEIDGNACSSSLVTRHGRSLEIGGQRFKDTDQHYRCS